MTLTLSFCIIISCIGFSISVFIYSYRCRESCIYKLAHHEHSDERCTLDFLISSRANLFKDIDHARTPRAPHGACLTVYSHHQLLLLILIIFPPPPPIRSLALILSVPHTSSQHLVRAHANLISRSSRDHLRSTSSLLIIHVYTYYKRVRIDTRVRVFVINICIYVCN